MNLSEKLFSLGIIAMFFGLILSVLLEVWLYSSFDKRPKNLGIVLAILSMLTSAGLFIAGVWLE
ncbi:MAG: hypothetical protein LBK68_03105 [Candidatus Margulisbacteria bacterium]|jgi:hypothetical protein|nr:hypothetical protein [Candidatus Margulisiibacteriota bacterium]